MNSSTQVTQSQGIAEWGECHLDFLRRFLPYHHGVPGARWLNLLMNRINAKLFSATFTSWVRETWPDRVDPDRVDPDRVDVVAIDGKTSRRSHDRKADKAPLHLVSAFATTSRLVLGQEAVGDKSGETSAIPVLLERLAADDGLKGALVSIDAIATYQTIATAICAAKADYLLAVKANQPSLRAEIESFFADAPVASLETTTDSDKGHGRIEQRTVTVSRNVEWLHGDRRFPGELRLPMSKPSCASPHAQNSKTAAASRPGTTSRPPSSPPSAPPPPFAVTGPSKTACTGFSTSLSPRTSRAYAPATAQKTWPSSGISPSISFAPSTTRIASGSDENAQVGI